MGLSFGTVALDQLEATLVNETSVAEMLHDHAVVGGDDLSDDLVVDRHCCSHRRRISFPKQRTAFDVRHHEGDGAAG
jgi:hypothetical protein